MTECTPAPETPPETAYAPTYRFFNRELSWLAFNRRVLAEAQNQNYPVLERLRFLSISGSNLDEFMMVRVAGLAAQIRQGVDEVSIDGLTPAKQLQAAYIGVEELVRAQQAILADLTGLLDGADIHIIGGRKLEKAQADWLAHYFQEHVFPALTPQAIDPAHPFPFINNQGTGILFTLVRLADGEPVTEMILIPPALPSQAAAEPRVTAPVPVKIGLVTLVVKLTALLVLIAPQVPPVPKVIAVPPPVRLPLPLGQVKVTLPCTAVTAVDP